MSEIDHYDYHLPRNLIAQEPLPQRADARLLVVDRAADDWEHCYIRDLPDLLAAEDCLVLNDTRVVPARLLGRRTSTGGRWEGLFLAADEAGHWQVLSKTRGKCSPGETITLVDRDSREACRLLLLAKLDGGVWAAKPEADQDTFALLDRIGHVPLPPYIRDGRMTDADLVNYQTVFAKRPGAVAAPTAGLHFTESLLKRIAAKGTGICATTLHVGLGTFRPISADRLDEHQMHSEWGSLSEETVKEIQQRRDAGGRIIAIGTTVVRVLETAAKDGPLQPWQGQTDLFIRPPYQFRAIDALLTNFHLPKSTLLVLVRTFGGDDLIRRAYEAAIAEEYRFYSYGDAMLIL